MRTERRRTRHSWPALAVACWVALGLWCGSSTLLPELPLLLLLLLPLIAGTGLVVLLLKPSLACLTPFTGSAILLSFLAGVVLARSDDHKRNSEHLSVPAATVTLWGCVRDYPLQGAGVLRFTLDVSGLISDSAVLPLHGICLVTVRLRGPAASDTAPVYGSTIAVYGELDGIPFIRNPGEFDPAQYYATQGITLLLKARSPDDVHVLGTSGGWWLVRDVVAPLRRRIIRSVDESIGGEEGEFLKGLMIGEKAGLSPELREAFLVSGVAHILAVSGSNVAVVAGSIMVFLSFFRLPRRCIPFPTALALIGYMLLTGGQPPVVRATIMALLLLLAGGWGIRGNSLNAIGIAALLMFVIDPGQIHDIGFQLSFGAVVSIILFYPLLNGWVHRIRGATLFRRLVRVGLQLAAVSAASSIGTLPLTAVAFGQVSVVGIAANMVVVPLSGWSVVLGFVTAVSGLCSGAIAAGFAEVNRMLLWGALRVTEACAAVPFAAVDTASFNPLWSLPFYTALGALYHARHPAHLHLWIMAWLISANAVLVFPDGNVLGPGELRVTIVDVGQGDAILLEHAGGGAALIDTGPPPGDGVKHLQHLLRRNRIKDLDFLVLTHPHDDHTGGQSSVCETARICTVYSGGGVSAGTHLAWVPGVRLQVLYSGLDARDTSSVRRLPNRSSIVIRLLYGSISLLFMADAEEEEERRLLDAYGGRLASTVMKVGHHGSAAATSEEFLAAVHPALAVISVGHRNRFGHPAKAVVQRLVRHGADIARTDEDGAVIVVTDGTVVRRVFWRRTGRLASRDRDDYHTALHARQQAHGRIFQGKTQTTEHAQP